MNKKLLWYALLGGGAYLLYVAYQKHQADKRFAEVKAANAIPDWLEKIIPKGATATGKVQNTVTGRPPGYPEETVAYAAKKWAEMLMPDGTTKWIEVIETPVGAKS